MLGRRFFPLFLAAAIFILQGGDCVSSFVADKQAHDCCQKGHCSRKNPDPCCQVSSNTTVTQAQAKEKASFVEAASLSALPAWVVPVIVVNIDHDVCYGWIFAPSPPGQLGDFSLPLLV
jgi:hypothetical protein